MQQSILAAATGERVQVPGSFFADDVAIDPTDSYAGIRFSSDGYYYKTAGPSVSWSSVAPWLITGSASDYDIEVTRQSPNSADTFTGASESTWLNLGSTRDWYFVCTSIDWKYTDFRVRIRDASTLTVLDDSGANAYYCSASVEV